MGGAGNEQSEFRGGHRQVGWVGGHGKLRSGMTGRVIEIVVSKQDRELREVGRGPDQDFSPFILSLLLFTTTIGYPNHLLNN